MDGTQSPPAAAALVIQNGRLSGTRRSLTLPVTLLGQAVGCDIRLNIDGINPLHCAIVQVPGGLLLRDLGSDQGTYVNQERVTTWPLAAGDLIGVGPFLFRVEMPAGTIPDAGEPPVGLIAERDAVRIQAAAVAAQQAKLTDEEAQLNQRGDALEKREQQIAEHLEDRQRRLLELRNEIKLGRTGLETDRDVFEEKKATLQAGLTKARKQADRERRRFAEARKRFKQRWLRYTAEKQTALRQREQQLLAEQESLQKKGEALRSERQHFDELRRRLNGEVELGRREVKEAWETLGLSQQQWDEALNAEHRERDQRLRILEAREAAVAEAEGKLNADQEYWHDTRIGLLKEIEGLETRVLNQRYQLQDVEHQLRPPAPAATPPPHPPPAAGEGRVGAPPPVSPTAPLLEVPAVVRRVAENLADQRWLLLEHWSRFLQIEQAWERERAALIADAEQAEQSLRERERRFDGREKTLGEREAELRARQERFARTRAELECRQSRLTLGEANEQGARAAHLAAVAVREQTATALVEQLEAVRRRRQQRRRAEIEELRQARLQRQAAQQEYLSLIRRFQERQAELAREQGALAARTVAVERYRLELVNRAPNSPAAEKQLEKLRRRSRARIETAERQLTAQRQTLLAEGRRLEERARLLQRREDELAAHQEQLARGQAEWEQQQLARGQAELPRERESHLLQIRHEHDTRQLAVLREEVERVARALLEDAEGVSRAA